METRTLPPMAALKLQSTLNLANAHKLQAGPEHYKIEVCGDMLLVDPVNADPFVFVAPATVHVFASQPGSGTDHLRQRMLADALFRQLADAREPH